MSASIFTEPVANGGKLLSVGAPSGFIESIKRAFGQFPVELGPKDTPVLRGMAATSGEGRVCNPYQELIDRIGEDTVLNVWAEY